MKNRLLAALGVSVVIAIASPRAEQAPPLHAECSHLVMLKFPDVKVTEAAAVPAAQGATSGAIRVPHCKVSGVIGTEIKFTLLLPNEWNGKFFMGGGGGFVGTVQNSAQATVNLGYATAGTDTGHQGGAVDGKWALNNVERRVNFGYLAVHRTADVAKSIIASYYGSASTRRSWRRATRSTA